MKRISDFLFPIVGVCVLLGSIALAQPVDEIKSSIAKVDQGQIDDVKKVLPDLIAKYQNTPGLMYLQGRLASDGIEAVKFYQAVVDNFPKSEWADDALYHIYQYYYSLGLYRTANAKMQQLKKEYPSSSYLTGKQGTQLPKQEEAPVKLPPKESIIVDAPLTAKTTPPQQQSVEPYTLQTGAFSTIANAEKQKNFFEDLGYSVDVTNKIRGGRSLYLVWVGSYKTSDEARTVGKQLRTRYKIDSIIVERY